MVVKMSNIWVVEPNESVNGIRFGTDRKTVREILGRPERIFRKTPDSANTTDAYLPFHVYYSADDRFEAIELFDKKINLSVNSRLIYPGTLDEIRTVLPDLEGEYGSYISKGKSVGIYVEDGEIVSVLVGRKDYYNHAL